MNWPGTVLWTLKTFRFSNYLMKNCSLNVDFSEVTG